MKDCGLRPSRQAICDAHLAEDRFEKPGSHRPIIMTIQSKLKGNVVLQNKKQFNGTQIFPHEDLTRMNRLVLTCGRKKMRLIMYVAEMDIFST